MRSQLDRNKLNERLKEKESENTLDDIDTKKEQYSSLKDNKAANSIKKEGILLKEDEIKEMFKDIYYNNKSEIDKHILSLEKERDIDEIFANSQHSITDGFPMKSTIQVVINTLQN